MSQAPPPSGQPVPQMQSPPYGSPQPAGSGTSATKILLIVAAVFMGFVLMCACGGILVALLLPAVGGARQASRRMQCSNNMKLIGLAMHNYHSAYKQLPAAYTTNAKGERLHSWRVALLPFMDQQALYQQIDLTRPWDDPVNQLVAQSVVSTYSCPSNTDPTLTTYVVIDDVASMFPGPKAMAFRDVLDGLANTIMVVEVEQKDAVHWMSPDNVGMATFLQVSQSSQDGVGHSHMGGHHVIMGDGAVVFITDSTETRLKQALATRAGKETIDVPAN